VRSLPLDFLAGALPSSQSLIKATDWTKMYPIWVLVTVKSGHCDNQIRPLRPETAQYQYESPAARIWPKVIFYWRADIGTHPAKTLAGPFGGRLIELKRRERRFEAANSKAAVRQCALQDDPVGALVRRQAKPVDRCH
jgi:hypothetical protein